MRARGINRRSGRGRREPGLPAHRPINPSPLKPPEHQDPTRLPPDRPGPPSMCLLPPKRGHTRVSPRRAPPGTILPSTCLSCLLPPTMSLLPPGPIAPTRVPPHPHVSFQPPRRPRYSPKSFSAPFFSCPLFLASTCLSCPTVLLPSLRLSRAHTPRLVSYFPNSPTTPQVSPPVPARGRSPKRTLPGPCGSMRRRRRWERVWQRGGPCRAVPSRAAPPCARPRGPNHRVLRQRPAAFNSGISYPAWPFTGY